MISWRFFFANWNLPVFQRDAFRVLKIWDWKFDAFLVPPQKKNKRFLALKVFLGGAPKMGGGDRHVHCAL